MRMRPLVLSLLLGTTSALVLSGCSGKPENSPVIRKKFAEVDKMQETITTLVADNTALQDQVAQLTKENSELRTFLPDADGTPILEKLTALESRMAKVESLAGDRMVAQASTSSTPAPSAP